MLKIDEKLLLMLEELGLTNYEAKAYIALIMRGISTASEIIEVSSIPQPRIYDIMTSLEEKGFVETQEGRPRKYRPINPKIAFHRYMEQLKEKQRHVTEVLSEVYSGKFVKERPAIWITRGEANIIGRSLQTIKEAETELLVAIPSHLSPRLIKDLKEAYKRGVNISLVLYHDKMDERILKELGEIAEIRVREVPSMITVIADRDIAVICSHEAIPPTPLPIRSGSYGITLENRELVKILSDFYHYTLWRPAKSLTRKPPIKYPSKFVYIWNAIKEIKRLQVKGTKVLAIVEGRYVKTGQQTRFEAPITDIVWNPKNAVYSIILEPKKGERISVGGWGASVEDVEANVITIIPKKSP